MLPRETTLRRCKSAPADEGKLTAIHDIPVGKHTVVLGDLRYASKAMAFRRLEEPSFIYGAVRVSDPLVCEP